MNGCCGSKSGAISMSEKGAVREAIKIKTFAAGKVIEIEFMAAGAANRI
jgi:hypothetical protein